MLETPIPLRARLLTAAEIWSSSTGRSLGALSSLVTNHGSTLERLRDPANKVTDATLERFAAFLADPGNWPEALVPEEAIRFAHVIGVRPEGGAPATGKARALSRKGRRADKGADKGDIEDQSSDPAAGASPLQPRAGGGGRGRAGS